MPTLEEVLDYLGIDYADEVVRSNVAHALHAAIAMVKGSVGEDVLKYLPENPKVKELVFLYTADLYDERNTSTLKTNAVNRRIVDSMELQLKLELRRKKENLL